jgi:hydroxypyruvate isomerase
MKFSACIEMLFTEVPFIERLNKAKEHGFHGVEFWNWDNKDLKAVAERAGELGLEIVTMQSNLGGTLIDPSDRPRFVENITKSIETAKSIGVKRLFLLTDELAEDRSVKPLPYEISDEEKYESVLSGLKELAGIAENAGVTLVLEPLNTLVDHKGYYLNHSALGFKLVREVGSPAIRLLYDIYHMQVMEGNLIATITENSDLIGHVHVADVPGRHEPGTGEINYANIYEALQRAGYDGYVGFEFEPTGTTEDALAEVKRIFRF